MQRPQAKIGLRDRKRHQRPEGRNDTGAPPQKRPVSSRPQNPRFGKTGWCCEQSDTNRSAVGNSLLTGKEQGILRFRGSLDQFRCKKRLRRSHFSRNSLRNLTGKIFQGTGNFLQVSGNSGSRTVSAEEDDEMSDKLRSRERYGTAFWRAHHEAWATASCSGSIATLTG
jgi:hypothetical protein